MEYSWYDVRDLEKAMEISQGDIINCEVPVIKPSDEPPYFEAFQGSIKGIVMTQACDLENGKIKVNEITLCPLQPLDLILKSYMLEQNKNNKDFKYEELSKRQQEVKYNYAEKIRQGNILDYYLLNKYESIQHSDLNMDYQVVSLRHMFRLPVISLQKQLVEKPIKRLRLQPPYREHLSHAYTFNFSRIGLPSDIRIPQDI